MTKINNLKITDNSPKDKLDKIKDLIEGVEKCINKSFKQYDKEICHEYNLGSPIQPLESYLVVCSFPKFENNPYVFVMFYKDGQNIIVDEASSNLFDPLLFPERYDDIIKKIEKDYERAPRSPLIGRDGMKEARHLAQRYDEGHDL